MVNKEKAPEGILQIHIPPRSIYKSVSKLDNLLDDREELLELVREMDNITKKQQDYLISLLNLEVSVFTNEEINSELYSNPLFFSIARHNLFERTLTTIKELDDINKDNVFFELAIPQNKWLDVTGFSDSSVTAIKLLEFELFSEGFEITIYDSAGFSNEEEERLRTYYRDRGKSSDYIDYWINEHRQKRNLTKLVAQTLLTDWNVSDFYEDSSYEDNVKIKRLAWGSIYKRDIDKE